MSDITENTLTTETSDTKAENSTAERADSILFLIVSIFLAVFLLYSIFNVNSLSRESITHNQIVNNELFNKVKFNFVNYLNPDKFSNHLRDTVYTNDNLWLEFRADKQTLYVHYRDGSIKEYPVSSGNKYISKSVEARSGLFAIFSKTELHLSSQFNNAEMLYYMPFNMGIGFHGLTTTGYYSNLGVRPSSHGCIRMRNDHVKNLYSECKIGTLVLVHYGESARVIAFAPEGFENPIEYNENDYKHLLAHNLNTIYTGNYFINSPKRFVINPKIIPRHGFYIGDHKDVAREQFSPKFIVKFPPVKDYFNVSYSSFEISSEQENTIIAYTIDSTEKDDKTDVFMSNELIKKLTYNPNGILPYFPPEENYYNDSYFNYTGGNIINNNNSSTINYNSSDDNIRIDDDDDESENAGY